MYYPCSENKGADQLRGYRKADLRLCFRICKKPVFSQRGSYRVNEFYFKEAHLSIFSLRYHTPLPQQNIVLGGIIIVFSMSVIL